MVGMKKLPDPVITQVVALPWLRSGKAWDEGKIEGRSGKLGGRRCGPLSAARPMTFRGPSASHERRIPDFESDWIRTRRSGHRNNLERLVMNLLDAALEHPAVRFG